MMARAPASASISAEISPVWAPDGFGWQSCAPTPKPPDVGTFSAKAAISVAGGQTRRSALAATAGAPASMASNSPSEDFRPFIFQLPAISGRIVSVILGFPSEISGVKHALAEPSGQFQMLHLQSVRRPPLQFAHPAKVATRRLPLYDALSTRRFPVAALYAQFPLRA